MTERLPRAALVIGAGFIGTHVCLALIERGVSVRVLNRSPLDGDRLARLAGCDVRTGDVNVRPSLRDALEGMNHVFYCAGGLMPFESNLDPVADVTLSVPPLLNVLQELRDHPGVALTYVSSGGTVYGDPQYVPVREDHPTAPITSYGVLKVACEHYALMYNRLYGVRTRVLRCSNAYGEFQPAARGQGFIAAALKRLSERRPLVLFGDGLNVRDYVFAPDIARVMVDLSARSGGPTVLNVGSGEGITLLDLVALLERITGRKAQVELRPDRGFDVRRVVLDTTALRAVLPFTATSLEEGIAATWSAAYETPDGAATPGP
jgi:UDP-glucose 4-epimerase